MPTNEIYTSFSDLSATAFRTYATNVCEGYPMAPERQRAQAYLQQVVAQDKASIAAARQVLNEKSLRRLEHQEIVEDLAVKHAHDYGRAPTLFDEQVKSDAEILALLAQDNAEVYIRDRNIAGTVQLLGDNVKFAGLGSTGTAVGGDLAHTCIVTGRIIISGSDVTLEGLHFKFDASWVDNTGEYPMISFVTSNGSNQKLTLRNCTFENTGSHADGRFFCGAGSGGGVQRIEGCRIKDFTSWLLLDATTNSGAATVKLDSFVLTACKIENCMGSMAVRGKDTDPNPAVSFTDNLVAYGALGQHASFWDCFEANNTLRVLCTGNTVTGAVHGANRGFLQCWSRSPVPWSVRYLGNTIANFGAAVRIACNATFYCPNTYEDAFSLKSIAAETTNVTNGASFVYPYNDATKTYAPENLATFPEPAGDFEGLSNFAHA